MRRIPTFESVTAALQQQLKNKAVIDFFFSDISIEATSVLTRSHPARHTPDQDNVVDEFDANDWSMIANEPQAHDNLALLLSTLILMEKQKYHQTFLLILATDAIHTNAG